jgi:hypothetical protein
LTTLFASCAGHPSKPPCPDQGSATVRRTTEVVSRRVRRQPNRSDKLILLTPCRSNDACRSFSPATRALRGLRSGMGRTPSYEGRPSVPARRRSVPLFLALSSRSRGSSPLNRGEPSQRAVPLCIRRRGQPCFRRKVKATFTDLLPSFHDMTVQRAAAARALSTIAEGDSSVAEGYIHTFLTERDGRVVEAEEFLARSPAMTSSTLSWSRANRATEARYELPPMRGSVDRLIGWNQVDERRDDTCAGGRCLDCGWNEGGEI